MLSQDQVQDVLQQLEDTGLKGCAFRKRAMQVLAGLPHYDWCGVYRLEGDVLVLDEYVGETTEHARIAVGIGVCGTAVAEDRNQIVPDVAALDNYLACSLETASEIVVLIRCHGAVLGQIDIDSHRPGAFDESDERLLEQLAERIVDLWSS